MKVLKSFGPQDLRVVEVEVPKPKQGQVRIKVKASGICGSDRWIWGSEKSNFIGGHEVAGEVEALGEGVTSLKLGDPVMVNNVGGCGICRACKAGAFVLCPAWDGSGDVNNGFGEYLVAPARNCVRILPGLDFIDGALIMDNWGTPYGAIKKVCVEPGVDVLVNGCGPIGQAAVGICKALGAYIIACDPIAYRRELALQNGASAAYSPEELPVDSVDVVLECSGDGKAYEPCLKALRIGGKMAAIGENANLTLQPSDLIIRRSLSLIGSWYSTLPQAEELMQLALQGRINVKSFLTHKPSLEEVPGLFGSIINRDAGLMKCIIVL